MAFLLLCHYILRLETPFENRIFMANRPTQQTQQCPWSGELQLVGEPKINGIVWSIAMHCAAIH